VVKQRYAKAEAALIEICLGGAQYFFCTITAGLEAPEVLDFPQELGVFDNLVIGQPVSQSRQVIVLQRPVRETQ
jgi:hypothetical protein